MAYAPSSAAAAAAAAAASAAAPTAAESDEPTALHGVDCSGDLDLDLGFSVFGQAQAGMEGSGFIDYLAAMANPDAFQDVRTDDPASSITAAASWPEPGNIPPAVGFFDRGEVHATVEFRDDAGEFLWTASPIVIDGQILQRIKYDRTIHTCFEQCITDSPSEEEEEAASSAAAETAVSTATHVLSGSASAAASAAAAASASSSASAAAEAAGIAPPEVTRATLNAVGGFGDLVELFQEEGLMHTAIEPLMPVTMDIPQRFIPDSGKIVIVVAATGPDACTFGIMLNYDFTRPAAYLPPVTPAEKYVVNGKKRSFEWISDEVTPHASAASAAAAAAGEGDVAMVQPRAKFCRTNASGSGVSTSNAPSETLMEFPWPDAPGYQVWTTSLTPEGFWVSLLRESSTRCLVGVRIGFPFGSRTVIDKISSLFG